MKRKLIFGLLLSFTVVFGLGCSKHSGKDRSLRFKKLSIGDKVKSSKGTYLQFCSRCHGERGKGKIGPSLVDSTWTHASNNPKDVARIIREGVVKKGMPPWGHILGEDEALSLAQWILSLESESQH